MIPLFNIKISLGTYVQIEVLEELFAMCVTEAQLLETKFPMDTTSHRPHQDLKYEKSKKNCFSQVSDFLRELN